MATHSSPEYQQAWFAKNPGKWSTYYQNRKNRPARLAYMRKWRAENPRRNKHYQLKLKFGISLGQYEEMHKAQKGLCAICGKPSGKLALAVDHNHETQVVRDLLCGPCNAALERLESVPNWCELAAAYLVRHDCSFGSRSPA